MQTKSLRIWSKFRATSSKPTKTTFNSKRLYFKLRKISIKQEMILQN